MSTELDRQARASYEKGLRESLISTLNEQIQAKQLRREQAKSTSLLIDKENLQLVNQAEREH
jgi:hypothetical protein